MNLLLSIGLLCINTANNRMSCEILVQQLLNGYAVDSHSLHIAGNKGRSAEVAVFKVCGSQSRIAELAFLKGNAVESAAAEIGVSHFCFSHARFAYIRT